MILYFLRHGLAGEQTEWQGEDDLRPLTPKGIKKMKIEAETISELDLELDRIITSPLVRAVQTAEIVATELGMKREVIQDERLTHSFNLQALTVIVASQPQAEALLLVGHEPSFSETISALIGGGRVVMKKGGLARVDITGWDPLMGELTWLVPPKVLAHSNLD